ncbi:transposase [Halomonas nitroreducens]|uniref:Transposase n=1 Tax=Halomonas nitroreducens TaxID=447425 RepID=A0A3S0K2V7_9GAMM|nr:transposase [Halomonas nitroreducens]RTR02958.1 transposase [Halomonas nitroreducens]
MPKSRAPYPAEFRQQIIELVRTGRTPEELAKEFEPTAQTIHNWVMQADCDAGRRHEGPTSDEQEELRRLRREVKQLREEREILANHFG